MFSAFHRLLGFSAAALMLAACVTTSSGNGTVAEGENLLILGAPNPAAPAAAPQAATTATAPSNIVAASPAPAPAVAPVTPTAPAKPVDRRNSYRLRARDFVRVLVINEPDTQIERRINPDGTVDVPYLKQIIPVAGLTITEAQDEIAKQFRIYFKEPQVVMSIVSYAERRVYVSGYVGKPGPVSIPPEEILTLGRALSMAGGILPRGRRSDVAVKRIHEGATQVITKDMRRIDSGEEPDFILDDEDQIYVEDSRI
jgi:protein involved in polysaccharide export with SLBB domain